MYLLLRNMKRAKLVGRFTRGNKDYLFGNMAGRTQLSDGSAGFFCIIKELVYMKLYDLQKNVRILATMEETDTPVVSCYLNAEQGCPSCRAFLSERTILLKRIISHEQQESFDRALEHIERFVHENAYSHDVRGIAVFVRTVENPFFLGLRFRVPLPNQLIVDRVPNIYNLIELKDTYDRYVVVLMTRERVSILEVNLGSVTRQTWSEHPALPERIGREWTKEQYQRHRRKQTEITIREKIKVLDRLVSAAGHSHLILAGDAHMVERLKANLPTHLRQKLIDTVFAKANDKPSDIVEATLSSFIEFREQESHTYVEMLQQAMYTNGLGVTGTRATLQCLRHARADVLILAKEYSPGPSWRCSCCLDIQIGQNQPNICPECSTTQFRKIDMKEEMVRLAQGSSCEVIVIRDSNFLVACGGVGCLNRY
jgi:peptide subunit release factor 1 (eRF1)